MDLTGIQTIADSALFVLILLVQLIIYPSFRFVEEGAFVAWHGRYTGLIGMIVAPLMILQVAVEVAYFLQYDLRWIRILCVLAIWGATFSLSVPCHSRLHREGKNLMVINRLVLTNWIRTLFWSVLFLETVFTAGGSTL